MFQTQGFCCGRKLRAKPQKDSANFVAKTFLKWDSKGVLQCLAVWRSNEQQIPDLISHYSSSPPSINWLAMCSCCPEPWFYLAQMSFKLHLPVSSFLGLPCAKLAQCLVMHRQVHLKKFITVAQERINRCLNAFKSSVFIWRFQSLYERYKSCYAVQTNEQKKKIE